MSDEPTEILLDQPVDQFLGTADRQRRNVVNRLIWIQLGALPTDLLQGVDDVRADAEQPQFEYLEKSDGARADDDHLRGVCLGRRCSHILCIRHDGGNSRVRAKKVGNCS